MTAKVMEIIKKYSKYIMIALGLLVICLLAYIFYQHFFNKPELVQGTSQTMMETSKGVEIAGEKAGYKLDRGQSQQVAQAIREIRTERVVPEYIVTTTGSEVKATSEQARKDNHADFSLVTNKNNPDEAVDLDKINKDAKVELQQYNIHCYKKVIRTIDVQSNKQATFTISKKITNDGQYLGIGAGYDWENNRVIAKVSYSW